MTPDDELLTADRALVAALANGDASAAAALLDDEFSWVNVHGRMRSKPQAAETLPPPPLGAERGLIPVIYRHGDVAHVTTGRDKVFVLRIWVKRAAGWRTLVYHEVSQNLAAAPHGPGRKDWDNPCRTLPYEPRNEDERRSSSLRGSYGSVRHGLSQSLRPGPCGAAAKFCETS